MGMVEIIKELAMKKSLTMAELERKAGLGAGTISRWDNRMPGIDKVEKVAEYFNVSIDYLLGRTDIPTICTGGEQDSPIRLAAHIDEDGMTEDEMEEIINYISYVKSKHKK